MFRCLQNDAIGHDEETFDMRLIIYWIGSSRKMNFLLLDGAK